MIRAQPGNEFTGWKIERSDPARLWQYFLSCRSDSFWQREIELLLLRTLERRRRSRKRQAERAQNAQAALDPVWPNGVGNGQQTATRIASFVSFHGDIMKQGVGHGLSNG
jgi:hypothetical protein